MDCIISLSKSAEVQKLSTRLGFTRTFYKDDYVLLQSENDKELLHSARRARAEHKLIIVRPVHEEQVRFILEKVPADMILGLEQLAKKDSVRHSRGGLDHILCAIAAKEDKTIAFSFHDLLHAISRPLLLVRMMANIYLCKKYKVKMFFSLFAESERELRSAADLLSLWQLLGGRGTEDLCLPFDTLK